MKKYYKTVIVVAIVIMTLCETAGSADDSERAQRRPAAETFSYHYYIDGIECIHVSAYMGAGGGLSCNWAANNRY